MNKLRKILTAFCAVAVVAVSSSSAFAQTPPDQLDGFAVQQPAPTLSGVASSLGVEPGNLANELVSYTCLLYTSPSPRDQRGSRMPSSA